MISLLVALAPVLIQIGLKVIDWTEKDEAQKQQRKLEFLALWGSHVDRAQKSVAENQDYAAQVAQLKGEQNADTKSTNE